MANDVKGAEEMKTSQQRADELMDEIASQQKDMKDLDDDQRDILIQDFNSKNKGIAELLSERADDEYVAMTKKEFEEYQSAYITMKYEVETGDEALRTAQWLKDYNKTQAGAPGQFWVGLLKFDEVITDAIKQIKEEENPKLEFDFGALTYTYQVMMQPYGKGIEYARWMLANQEVYNKILNKLADHMHTIDLIKKKIGLLQTRWALACNGFKMNMIAQDLSDFEHFGEEDPNQVFDENQVETETKEAE